MTTDAIGSELINAYLDGELDDATRARVEDHLARHPEAMADLKAYAAQSDALRQLYDPILEEPIPERLLNTLTPPEASHKPMPGWLARGVPMAAAAGVTLAVGMALGWLLRSDLYEQEAERLAMRMFLQQASSSYSLYAQDDSPWRETSLEEDRDRFGEWFSERREVEIAAPELEDAGFRFIGGRALPTSNGSAGQMLYRNDDDETIAIYFQSGDKDSLVARALDGQNQAAFLEQDDVAMYHWNSDSGSTRYAVLGAVDKDMLGSLAQTVFDHFR